MCNRVHGTTIPALRTVKRAARSETARGVAGAVSAAYLLGRRAYERGAYAEAIAELEEAYRLSARPDLLCSIAVCRAALAGGR